MIIMHLWYVMNIKIDRGIAIAEYRYVFGTFIHSTITKTSILLPILISLFNNHISLYNNYPIHSRLAVMYMLSFHGVYSRLKARGCVITEFSNLLIFKLTYFLYSYKYDLVLYW